MNETRITAYALNELKGNERDNFESDLAADQRLQAELQSASLVADGLAQVMTAPGDGLEPRAREQLLRAIVRNQQTFRQRRKIVRFAVPVSLAAAASIAVLLWVTGGKTTQESAVAAADGGRTAPSLPRAAQDSPDASPAFVASGQGEPTREMDDVPGRQGEHFAGRTIRLSDRAQAVEMTLENKISMTAPPVRVKSFIWDERLPRLGSSGQEQP